MLGSFGQFLKNIFYKTTYHKSFIFCVERSHVTLFLVYSSNKVAVTYVNDFNNNLCKTHFRLLSNCCTYFHEIWLKYKKGFSGLFKSRLYDIFSSNNANELLDSYVTFISFTMYYYMSPCNIPFFTSLKPMHIFAPNFVLMFIRRTPTKFIKMVGTTFIFHGIMCNFVQFFFETLDLFL